MSGSEKLCLQWNDYQESIVNSFGVLKVDKDLADVTLVCEDGQQMEAHKVVLASSSPFFMTLLKKSKHPRPLIYMRGLKSNDLTTILNFLYVGEANVFQEDLDSFLVLAEELQLKGLTGAGDTKNKGTEDLKVFQRGISKSEAKPLQTTGMNSKPKTHNFDTTVALNETTDNHDLNKRILSMITKSSEKAGKGQGYLGTCNVCGKEAAYQNLPRHVEANHITGITHECDICGKMSRSAHGLRQHKTSFHATNG